MRGEDILISEEAYKSQVRGILLILWNVYKYFVMNAQQAKMEVDSDARFTSTNVLDKWVMALTQDLIGKTTKSLESYDSVSTVQQYYDFIQEVSTWYIRRSRDRSTDREFLSTLHLVLVTLAKLMAPIAPFISEEIYRNLTNKESVHLENWPVVDISLVDKKLLERMEEIRNVVELGHQIRKKNNIKVRQPLGDLYYSGKFDNAYDPLQFIEIIKSELNVKHAMYRTGEDKENIIPLEKGIAGFAASNGSSVSLNLKIDSALKAEGEMREIVRSVQAERKNLGTDRDEQIDVKIPAWPKDWEEEIKKRALVKTLTVGEFKVSRLKTK